MFLFFAFLLALSGNGPGAAAFILLHWLLSE